MTDEVIATLCQQVSAQRLHDLTLELVEIPSPTSDAVRVTQRYAERVGALGLPVEMDTTYAGSPSTIVRWGGRGGAQLVLDGHLDTIHAPHPAPKSRDGVIYGRGAGDMKSGIAAMVETLRVLRESGITLDGELVLVTHALHEAPVGHMEALIALAHRDDLFTDAALVAEGGFDEVYIQGKGQAIFDVTISRQGEPLHENVARPRGIPNPMHLAAEIASAFVLEDRRLASAPHPLLGPETFFLGQIHGGDFYNRVPTRAYVNGIHRYWPDKDWEDVHARIHQVVDSIPRAEGLTIDIQIGGNGLGYAVDPDSRLVRALQWGYDRVTGRELPLVGGNSVSDVNIIAREAGIPVLGHGTGSSTAHADLESVRVADIVRTTRVFLATVVRYLGVAS
ncbi:MAG: M20 family metallopeptidase [Anaerolineae bacterium]|jgi:acetylornithine deacetylase/succinyl-diaminopimelate desuccinylase-like protein